MPQEIEKRLTHHSQLHLCYNFRMTLNHNLTIPEKTWQKLRHAASRRNLAVHELIETYLADETVETETNWSDSDPAVTREKEAFLQLHPQLTIQYPDQYVAILNGRVVDHDPSYEHLFKRVDHQFPDTFVWISKVEPEPLPPLRTRSPRFLAE